MRKHAILIALLALATMACAVGPNYKRPPVTSPEQFRGAVQATADPASLADQAWWSVVNDPVLKQLISDALEHSYDVRLAAARVQEARANAGIAKSDYFPAIQARAGWSRSLPSEFNFPGIETRNLYDVNLGLSWEVDLWGRIKRLNEAALARYLSTEEARRGVMLSLVSDVATGYFRLRTLDQQLEIARRTAKAFEGTHDLFAHKLEAGLASSLETQSAAAALAATNARIPDIEREIAAQENALAFLLGRNPGDIRRGADLTEQLLPPEIPVGLPSDLLERRPDLRQSEQDMVAANAEVGVTVADFFPRLSLTGAFGGVAPELRDLFKDGKSWSVGGTLLSPVFQGHRLKNQHQAALARWEQAKIGYERSVNNAFSEIATALTAYQKLAEVENEQSRAVDAYRDAVDRSNTRYLSGLADYLDVLAARQQLFPAENALAQARFERLRTFVELYRALGGGWKLKDEEWVAEAR